MDETKLEKKKKNTTILTLVAHQPITEPPLDVITGRLREPTITFCGATNQQVNHSILFPMLNLV